MQENKIEVLSDFFRKHVFNAKKIEDKSWVDGAYNIVAVAIKEELFNKSIEEIIEYFSVSGNIDDLDTYKKFDNLIKYNNPLIDFILNTNAKNTKLSYLQTLTEYIEDYKKNRNLEAEDIYTFCIANNIDPFTISLAESNLSILKTTYNSLPLKMSKKEKITKLRAKFLSHL